MISPINAASAFATAKAQLSAPSPAPGNLSMGIQSFQDTLNAVDQSSQAAMSGIGGAGNLVQSIAEAELALETVVTVRDKVVEAYQELMRMPI